jgi:hypothetical protein
VLAREYAFDVAAEVPSGAVTFVLVNLGTEEHELALLRLRGDVPMEELLQMPPARAGRIVTNVGGIHAPPGQSARLPVTLVAGRYGYVCFLHAPDGLPHSAKGMFGELTVT